MPVTDILNPTTILTNNAAVSSANALAVKVISGGGSGITINTSAITGGTTTRLLYDNGGTVGETAGLTFASVSAGLGLVGKMTITAADGAQAMLMAGTTNGVRFVPGNGFFEIDGVDQTGGASFQPLFLNGSVLDLGIAGTIVWAISSASVLAPLNGGVLGYGGITFASTVTGSGSLVGATNPTLSSLVASGTLTYGGVTFASTVTGSGSLVGATGPSLSSLVATGTLTYGGVALSSTVTGTGSMVLSASPTLSGTASFAATVHSGLATFSSAMVYGGVTLASTVTGTGSMVLSASPTLSGTASIAAATFSGLATFSSAQTTVGTGTFQNAVAASASVVSTGILFSSTASFGVIWGALGSVAPTVAVTQGTLLINTSGSSIASRMFIRTSSSWTSVTTAG